MKIPCSRANQQANSRPRAFVGVFVPRRSNDRFLAKGWAQDIGLGSLILFVYTLVIHYPILLSL